MRAKDFEEISPQRKYHGINTQIIAQIKNVRVPCNIDIGVGDIIFPRAEERTINTQLPDFEAPVIRTYSLESTIAEKFDAILQRFELTGRMKDFTIFTIFQGHSILTERDCNPLSLTLCSSVVLPTIETALRGLFHLPMTRICKNVGSTF